MQQLRGSDVSYEFLASAFLRSDLVISPKPGAFGRDKDERRAPLSVSRDGGFFAAPVARLARHDERRGRPEQTEGPN